MVKVIGSEAFPPLAPSPIGRTINGARIWARLGVISFQPGELAKILLAAFFAELPQQSTK